MKSAKQKMIEIANDAFGKRTELVQKFKRQGKGNVLINLVHGAVYTYGETIKDPQIVLKGGLQEDDWTYFQSAGII